MLLNHILSEYIVRTMQCQRNKEILRVHYGLVFSISIHNSNNM